MFGCGFFFLLNHFDKANYLLEKMIKATSERKKSRQITNKALVDSSVMA